MIITLETLCANVAEGELGYISTDFWHEYSGGLPAFRDITPDHPIWEELRAYQWGWLRCKKFYNIKD